MLGSAPIAANPCDEGAHARTDASWLSRIECHFTALKTFVLDKTDHQSHDERQQAIRKYVTWRNHRRKIIAPERHRAQSQRRVA